MEGTKRKYTVYYKTYNKGLKVEVEAESREEAIKIVKDSISIIEVYSNQLYGTLRKVESLQTEYTVDQISNVSIMGTLWISGVMSIGRRFSNFFRSLWPGSKK